jgi:hypothetical protein
MINKDIATRILNESLSNSIDLNEVLRNNTQIANFINGSIALAAKTIMTGKELSTLNLDEFGTIE